MSMNDQTTARQASEQRLERAWEKFEQLLNADPASPVFVRLFEEVDTLLTGLIQDEGYRPDGFPPKTDSRTGGTPAMVATLTKGS